MLESWPLLLIVAYFLTLLISLRKFPSLYAEELKIFSWYLVVGLLAAFHARWNASAGDGIDFQLSAFFAAMWYELARPMAIAFLCLNLPRWLLLYWRHRKQNQSDTL